MSNFGDNFGSGFSAVDHIWTVWLRSDGPDF
jgi:hypothetical protein